MYIYFLGFYMILMYFFLLMLFLYLYIYKMVMFIEMNLINYFSVKMELFILIDWISILFSLVVLIISLMVIMYSVEYMDGDKNFKQFIMLVYMFVVSMILMILSPNLISILIGWDGLGLSSYCLVIYYQSKNSFNSGMITVLINRLGDILILMSISLMMMFGSWNILMFNNLNWIMWMLIIASFTKSAQVPFSTWLPLAMAAPTPVSALVHSSTLVTAGIYLMIRMNYLMEDNNLNFLMFISVITMFLAGIGATFEFDFKKIIALSTLSQLGVMFFCLSLKLNNLTFFHLLTHAMFKSLLFMCAGVIIHNMMGVQDIRKISMVLFNMPLVSLMFNCSVMSLCGVPFLSGFFSKDLILEMYMMSNFNKLIFFLLFISMGLTVMYSLRLMFYSFIKLPQLIIYNSVYSISSMMGVSMYLLFFKSIISGLCLSWLLMSNKNLIYLTIEFKLMINFFMIIGMILGLFFNLYFFKLVYLMKLNNLIKFFGMLWFMPILFSPWVEYLFFNSFSMMKKIELGWMEYLMGYNMKILFNKFFQADLVSRNYFSLLIFLMLIYLYMYY